MDDILVEFDKYISTNKDVLNVLPVNTKKNKKVYIEKVDELIDSASKIKAVIWNEIVSRYEGLLDVKTNPQIAELTNTINNMEDIELFNELNTPFEKIGLDRICHSLSCFFEADLNLVNQNIKDFIEKFNEYGIKLSDDDFRYSDFVYDYMKVYFDEMNNGNIESDKLKSTFEQIYWKCPDIVSHIELNLRYLYYINSKNIEKELNERNQRTLDVSRTDKNGLVKQYFEVNKALIKAKRVDPKAVFDKFYSGEWKIKDFNDKEMSVLYDRYLNKDYFKSSSKEQVEINNNFGKLLNTLQEYNIYVKYKYIIDDLRIKYVNKDSFKDNFDKKSKELRKKEAELLKENKKHRRIVKVIRSPFLKFVRKKLERKVYEFPVATNATIKELNSLYKELDEEVVNTRIAQFVDDGCTLKYMFKIAISFYTYAYNLVKKQYEDDDVDVADELQGLINFIDQPYKVMLNNIKLIEEPEIKSIISSRYKILSIKLEEEDLNPESIDDVLRDVEKIVNYYNIQRSGLNIDDLIYIEKAKSLIDKANKNK